jgi:hypothetical protein
LTRAGERVSLAAIARVSKAIDSTDPDGTSESAILHNEEAYALYRPYAQPKRHRERNRTSERRTNIDGRLHVSADRDHGRARQRYLRASKNELVQRLLAVEKAYADMENRWLQTADDLLVWIMLVDRLMARKHARGCSS